MLDHVSISVNDLEEAEIFYDAVMQALGFPKVNRSDVQLGYGERCDASAPDLCYISILKSKAEMVPDRRRHWCFKARDRASVNAFWQAGCAHGGIDDGAPGLRPHYHEHYYPAFVLDPSGNCVEAVCHRAPSG